MSSSRIVIEAIAFDSAGVRAIGAVGQEGRTLCALVQAGSHGVTALECSAWAFRLAACCHALRCEHGLAICTDRESHPGGGYGRHVLETPVTIVSNSHEATEAARMGRRVRKDYVHLIRTLVAEASEAAV
jgi:hypothetical protein